MIELQPFTESDFDTFIGWMTDEIELYQFAGPIFTFPITKDQLESYLHSEERKCYKVVLTESQKAIGHCELNFEAGNHRLSRIILADRSLRGKGIGEQIVVEMVKLFFQDKTVQEVDLNVFDWNKGAIRCYEKVGFRLSNHIPPLMEVNGNKWVRLNMILSRVDFETIEKENDEISN